MTLDEAIKHAEEVAEAQEGRGYCDRSICVIMDENNHNCDECEAVKCRECATEHRQLAEWLKELQAHREAWEKVKSAVDQHTDIHSDGEFYIKNFDVKKIIAEYRPKEGDADADSD